jgi:hypothetical protein
MFDNNKERRLLDIEVLLNKIEASECLSLRDEIKIETYFKPDKMELITLHTIYTYIPDVLCNKTMYRYFYTVNM